ncbi:MAG TPA: SLC13 family permease [Ilumatobacteraceae bacterium]|nr:SLC13 family permease [Ilumatobacteraceae bacterium]
MAAVVLLVVGIAAMFLRPFGIPLWAGPVAAAAIGLITRIIHWDDASESLHLLTKPLLFLLFAVPLAIVLDRIGVFEALAATVDGGKHLVGGLWLLAMAVTIVFNLDASVVLLTPLYIRIAHRHGYPPEMLAFQPALLACLASNPLPVSNLTNLIVAEHFDLGVGEFLQHMVLPTIAACLVGWLCFRRAFGVDASHVDDIDEPVDKRALRRGLPIVGFVLVGFTVGAALGVPEWVVAAVALAWGASLAAHVPLRAIPYEAMLVAAGLAVLVAGAAPHLGLERIFDATGVIGRLRTLSFGVVASDVSNNLPAVLAGMTSLRDRSQVWALLIGANVGPVLVISGALSGLLWRDTAAGLGVEVSGRRYSLIGLKVGLPALIAASAVVVFL